MTTSKELNWTLKNSKVTYKDHECMSTHFQGKLSYGMFKRLFDWFKSNGATFETGQKQSSLLLYVGDGSLRLSFSPYKCDATVTVSSCLALEQFENLK